MSNWNKPPLRHIDEADRYPKPMRPLKPMSEADRRMKTMPPLKHRDSPDCGCPDCRKPK